MSEIVNAKELANKFQVTPATILAWARRGWIPSLRAGRRPVLFNVQEVEKALRERAERKEVADDQ
ncbi:MAG: helix-turn-helix domain-containing protein [Gemmataceae bacterium]